MAQETYPRENPIWGRDIEVFGITEVRSTVRLNLPNVNESSLSTFVLQRSVQFFYACSPLAESCPQFDGNFVHR